LNTFENFFKPVDFFVTRIILAGERPFEPTLSSEPSKAYHPSDGEQQEE
jgi:hypothetical protein